jgi:hypothetical protein
MVARNAAGISAPAGAGDMAPLTDAGALAWLIDMAATKHCVSWTGAIVEVTRDSISWPVPALADIWCWRNESADRICPHRHYAPTGRTAMTGDGLSLITTHTAPRP